MAEYRSVQTRMWREDEWFQELDAEARLFWIYLFTNPSASPAGIYRLPLRTMAFESGVSYNRAQQLVDEFATAGKAYYDEGVVWVVNMRRLQFPTLIDGSREWQTAVRIQKDLACIPDKCALKSRYLAHSGYPIVAEAEEDGKTVKRVQIQYPDADNTQPIPNAYPIDTPSVNSNITKQNKTVTETETETLPPPVAAPPKPARVVTPGSQQDMFGAIADTCQLDTKLKAGQIAKQSKALLEAGYTPAQVRAFPVWWQSHDWRGQRGNVPTLAQLAELIKQSTMPNGRDPVKVNRGGFDKEAEYKRKMEALLGD